MIVLLDSICEFLFAYLHIHVHQVPLEMWYSLRKISLIYFCLVFIHLFILFFSNSISSFNNIPVLKRKTEYFDGRLLCSCVNSPQSFLDNQSHQHNEPNLILTQFLKKKKYRFSLIPDDFTSSILRERRFCFVKWTSLWFQWMAFWRILNYKQLHF